MIRRRCLGALVSAWLNPLLGITKARKCVEASHLDQVLRGYGIAIPKALSVGVSILPVLAIPESA
jgi:hypothetical protein